MATEPNVVQPPHQSILVAAPATAPIQSAPVTAPVPAAAPTPSEPVAVPAPTATTPATPVVTASMPAAATNTTAAPAATATAPTPTTETHVVPTPVSHIQATQTKVIKMQGQSEPLLDLKGPQLLSSVDYGILFVIAFSALISLWRGFTREAFSLLVWLVAMCLAVKYGAVFVPKFTFIPEPMVQQGASYACVFLGALLVGGFLNMIVGRFISGSGLSVADRFFGIFFGAARGALFVAVIVLIAGFTPMPKESWWHGSTFIPHFERGAVWLRAYLPDNIKQMIVFPS